MKKIKELKKIGSLTDEREARIVLDLPARYKDVDVENFSKEQAVAQKWVYNKKKKNSLYLWGGVGTGKTYIAYAFYKLFVANGFKSLIANSTMILQDIKDDFGPKSKDPYYRSKFDYWTEFEGVLLIDDIGAEKPTDWVLETFYTLINIRYEKKLATIFTSNLNLEELGSRFGDRIASRIVEMSEIIKLEGKDRRLNK